MNNSTNSTSSDSVAMLSAAFSQKEQDDDTASTTCTKDEKSTKTVASVTDTLRFIFESESTTVRYFVAGCVAAMGHGLIYPALAFLISSIFSTISGASRDMGPVDTMAFAFLGIGAFALVAGTIQTGCFEVIATRAHRHFGFSWFKALLRQDAAFFDVHNIGGLASVLGPNCQRYRRGVGTQFAEGVQYATTAVGGLVYAFYSNWKTTLVVMSVMPFCMASAMVVMKLNQAQTSRANKAYSNAGGIANSSVFQLRTILSLNAISKVIDLYKDATQDAFEIISSGFCKQGLANGAMAASFTIMQGVLALYGASLLYTEVGQTGCNPSGTIGDANTCHDSGASIFGAVLGLTFAAKGASALGNFFSTFSAARSAAFLALQSINRSVGAKESRVYENKEDDMSANGAGDDMDLEQPEKLLAILPQYMIDASSNKGLKPQNIKGHIRFNKVDFSYPTRPNERVLSGLTLDVEPGQTVALVGPSGGGKSTTISLLERFYDPTSGEVELDGVDLRKINVSHLRSLIGYVGQEPTLFAASIKDNIRYGNPDATQEEIEVAARMANAHDFISSFPDGYDTQVGDTCQLSGGQRQRICIARVLVAQPKLLILDEATSALDTQSEKIVQRALDAVVAEGKRTTFIIAHRLTTIRNADKIVVVANGTVVEQGTHEALMEAETGHYRNLVQKQQLGETAHPTTTLPALREERSSESQDDSTVEVEQQAEPKMVSVSLNENHQEDAAVSHFNFKDVDFEYPSRAGKKVFEGFNLSIRQGETIALVGPSGGGKSTAVALVERFYDPQAGHLQYLGHNVQDLNLGWYRDQIGYVGQEPTLFEDTIANNIAYGCAPGTVTRAQIEEAAKQANAYDFIMGFKDGFDTMIGEGSAGVSGGQKQRLAIARALIKKPKVLLLDESTSALDSQSEAIVQAAIDELLATKDRTAIMIAHRLKTIEKADRIAYIAQGKVQELGSHDELMAVPGGKYRRLVETQSGLPVTQSLSVRASNLEGLDKAATNEDDNDDSPREKTDDESIATFSVSRIRKLAAEDTKYLVVGSIGALTAGAVLPTWGVLLANTLGVLYSQVDPCTGTNCEDQWASIAAGLQQESYYLALYWTIAAAVAVIGIVLLFWGFGMASERLNKRVRDRSFAALVRQEVGFFDVRNMGAYTSQMQEDAAKMYMFTGAPLQGFLVAIASVFVGIIISFVFMWPFALLNCFCIPLLAVFSSLKLKKELGEDQKDEKRNSDSNSPGSIILETLLNMRTISALTLEQTRLRDYENALRAAEPNEISTAFKKGFSCGIAFGSEQWVRALQFWFGGWLLYAYPTIFSFSDYLISNFSLLASMMGISGVFSAFSNRKETEESAKRIFFLLDRESNIDPLSQEGKKLQ